MKISTKAEVLQQKAQTLTGDAFALTHKVAVFDKELADKLCEVMSDAFMAQYRHGLADARDMVRRYESKFEGRYNS